MDEPLEAIGMRLSSEMRKYVSSPKKFKDLHLGIIIGLKASMDMMGEAKYALECVNQTIEGIEADKLGGKGHTAVQMLRSVV